jgi:hypothetical protein
MKLINIGFGNLVSSDKLVAVAAPDAAPIKRIVQDGAFVWYNSGDTAAKTPFDCMHKLVNAYCIGETSLGGAMT